VKSKCVHVSSTVVVPASPLVSAVNGVMPRMLKRACVTRAMLTTLLQVII
jgi:hypothetical protein